MINKKKFQISNEKIPEIKLSSSALIITKIKKIPKDILIKKLEKLKIEK